MSAVADTHSAAQEFYGRLRATAEAIEQRYRELTPASAGFAEEAFAVLPGGSTRHGVFRVPYPVYVASAAGSVLTDVDGRDLVDFCFNATALPLGHGHPAVVAALTDQVALGTAIFSPTSHEIQLARLICERLPSAEQVVFTNSGGEAVMTAIRVARAFTGREGVAKFEGSFHGSHDDVLWSVSPAAEQTGPLEAPRTARVSPGIPYPDGRVLVLPYNDIDHATALIDANATKLAAVLVEPLANRMGLVPPEPGFLEALRERCTRHGIVLIFDEILSFRVDVGGMQGRLGVTPDLTTLGKIIGGGLPVGGVAGRSAIMSVLDPRRPVHVYHTGTFAANPLTVRAGCATLGALQPAAFEELNRKGEWLRSELRKICRGVPLQVTGEGSLFKISATPYRLTNYRTTLTVDRQWQTVASMALLNEGFFFNCELNGCISTVTTDAQLHGLLAAVERLV